MVTSKYQITQLTEDGLEVLHPETDTDVIVETNDKKIMTAAERIKLADIEEQAQVNVIEKIVVNGNEVVPDSDKKVNITISSKTDIDNAISAHNTSSTAHSDIREAIESTASTANDALSIAKGRAQAVSFDTYEAMVTALKGASNTAYKVGDNLFIKTTGVPDYWISNVLTTNTGTYGYYEISALETQKIELSGYYTKTESDNKYETKTNASATYATKISLEELEGKVNTNTTNIGTANTEITKIKNGTTKVGKAGTADKLTTARTISLSGDVSGSASFDGSENKTINVTLESVGTPGTYSVVTTDAKGRVTAGGQILEVGTDGQTAPSSSLAIGGIFFKKI